MFKWCWLTVAVIVGGALLWMVNDLRVQARLTVDSVNRNLPEILEKTRSTADTMATLSQDIKQLRELVVGDGASRDGNIVAYESEILSLIENSGGKIGVKKMLGGGLSDPVPAREWVTRERKAALWDLARSRSKADLLTRIGHSAVLKRAWYIDTGGRETTALVDWVKGNHPASRELETPADDK
jgi:hypothetical protein